jgi:Transposase
VIETLNNLIAQAQVLVVAAIGLMAIAFVGVVWARTKSAVPTVGAVILGAVVIWGVSDTLGHGGRKADPHYRCRRLLTRADERLDEHGRSRLLGLLEAGDPRGEVRMAWHAKEVVRSIFEPVDDPDVALAFVGRLGLDLQDDSCPPEINQVGRTLVPWRQQIAAWHQGFVTNGPT